MQLLSGNPELKLSDVYAHGGIPDTKKIFERLVQNSNQNLERDATFLLILDGIQRRPGDAKREAQIQDLLHHLSDLSLQGFCCIVLCTASTYSLLKKVSKVTGQATVELPLIPIPSPTILSRGKLRPVFDEDDPLIATLVADCGGHGLALFALSEALGRKMRYDAYPRSIDSTRFAIDEMILVRNAFYMYSRTIDIWNTKAFKSVLKWVMERHLVTLDQPIPEMEQFTVEGLCSLGLFRFVRDSGDLGYLEAANIWVRLIGARLRRTFDFVVNADQEHIEALEFYDNKRKRCLDELSSCKEPGHSDGR